MADNVELRIVLVDEDGVGQAVQSTAGQQPAIGQTPFVPPTTPATIAGVPQQPATFQFTPQPSPLQQQAPAAPPQPQPATFTPPQQPATIPQQPVQQPTVNAQSQQTPSIYGFQQPVTTTQPPSGPVQPTGYSSGPASTSQPILNAITPRDEAQQILRQRAFDSQVQAELNKLDPPKPKADYSASTATFSALGKGAETVGLKRTAQTFRGAAEMASKGGAAAISPVPMAATLALDAFTDAAKMATTGLVEISTATATMARGQNFASITRAADDAASVLGKIPVVGGALEAGLEAASYAAKAFGNTVQAFVDRGAELAKFSPEVAQSRVMAEITQLRGDMRESAALGPSIARLTELQAEGSDQFREILLPMKKVISEDLVATLGKINGLTENWAPVIVQWLVTYYEEIRAIVQFLSGHPLDAANTVANVNQKIADALSTLANSRQPTGVQAEFVLGELMKAAKITLPQQQRPAAQPQPVVPAFKFP